MSEYELGEMGKSQSVDHSFVSQFCLAFATLGLPLGIFGFGGTAGVHMWLMQRTLSTTFLFGYMGTVTALIFCIAVHCYGSDKDVLGKWGEGMEKGMPLTAFIVLGTVMGLLFLFYLVFTGTVLWPLGFLTVGGVSAWYRGYNSRYHTCP